MKKNSSTVDSTKSGSAYTKNNSVQSQEPTIGKYQLLETLGEGSFGKVRLAIHEPTGKKVAIKIIDKSQFTHVSLRKVSTEGRIMKTLHHPNIVKLFQVIETKYTLYMVMEYASGGDVAKYLDRHGRMKEGEARAKFMQIVSAVEYCHQKRIIHRDLKCRNLLFDGRMNVKIADFGLSSEFTPGNDMDTFYGSPNYAAPELFLGEKYDGPKADIWSLGIILYKLVTGSLPFQSSTLEELRRRVLYGRYWIPFYVGTNCENLLRTLLVRNPVKRAGFDTIRKNKWLSEGNVKIKPYTETEQDMTDPKKIDALVHLGFERNDVINSLTCQKYDDAFAAYLLLDKKSTVPKNDRSSSSQEKTTGQQQAVLRPLRMVPSSNFKPDGGHSHGGRPTVATLNTEPQSQVNFSRTRSYRI